MAEQNMSETAKAETFRLENLEVKEVSLVTRPANKRTFAIVKSAEGGADQAEATLKMMCPKCGMEGAGAVCKECGSAMHKDNEAPATIIEAAAPAASVVVEQALLTEAALVSPAAEAFQGLHPVLASALPHVGPLVKRVENVLDGLTAGRFGAGDMGVKNFAGEVFSIAQSFSMLASSMDPTRPPGNDYAVQLADLQAKEIADKQLSEEVNKAGAKMAKERLARMKDAVNILLALVDELTQEEAALPGVFNNAEKSEAPSVAAPVATTTPTTKDDGLASTVATLTAELAEMKKAAAERDGMLAQLAKTRGFSNALPVDGPTRTKQPEAPTAWAFDLNGTQARGKVRPEHTFAATATNGKEQ